MIVLDIETSGLDFNKCGIWQIGAIDLETMKEFFDVCRLDDEEEVINESSAKKPVLEVFGKTEQELRDESKQSQKEMLEKFFKWAGKVKIKNCVCQNPQFDLGFIWTKAKKYKLKIPLHYRAFDLHSISNLIHLQVNGEFLIKENHSDMGLSNTLKFCGMVDNRKLHNALEDAKLTAECFSRLVYGKSLFPEFEKFIIPEYLKPEGKKWQKE